MLSFRRIRVVNPQGYIFAHPVDWQNLRVWIKRKCFWGCEIRILIYCWCNLVQLLQKIICFPFFQKIILNKVKDIYNLYTIYFVYRYILREVCVKEHQSIISTAAVTCKGPMLVVIEMFTQTRMNRFCCIQRVESYYKW